MRIIILNITIAVATVIYISISVLFCNLLFNKRANGSLIKINENIIGLKNIGQEFTDNKYFHGRPSLNHYNNSNDGNSNLPYISTELKKTIEENSKSINKTDLNLISESASGLDPHITLNSAIIQIPRISQYSGIKETELLAIVEKSATPRIFGLFGENFVNVLELNLKLRELYGTKNRS